MQIVNLTPHSITLRAADGADHTFPSAGVARVSSTPGSLADIGLPVPVASATTYGEVTGLPAPETGTYYVVSALVGAALRSTGSTRQDVLCPGTGPNDGAVRDEAGRIVAVTRLVRP